MCMVWSSAYAMTPADISEVKESIVFIGVYADKDIPKQLGSGFFISPSGMIMTNYHVIHKGKSIRVWKYGEFTYYEAIVVGIDPLADLALLQIARPANTSDESFELVKNNPFPYLRFQTDPEKIVTGVDVWAFGNPMSNRFVTTKGIITTDALPGFLSPFVRQIVHDAVLNSGSSGGPLLTSDGKVVGVNTYIMSPNGEYSGLGSAIRADTVMRSVNNMLNSDYLNQEKPIPYPALDIMFVELDDMGTNDALQKAFPIQKIPNTFGIMIRGIEVDDYSYIQGLRNYDTIVAVNGLPTNDRLQLADALLGNEIDESVILLVIRRGVFINVKFVLTFSKFDYNKYYDKDNTPQQLVPR
jgi:serine protease Do